MTLRKLAGLLAAFGITVGLIGSGVGATFLDQVTGTETINVGTFSCQIVAPSMGTISTDGKSVTYTAPTIGSSAAGSAPFSFTVKNTGSFNQLLTVGAPTPGGALGPDFSAIPATPSPVSLPAGGTQLISTGIQWVALSNDDLGRTGSMTWTVSCNENAAIFDNSPAVVPGNLPSFGFQSNSIREWGAGVAFAGTARKLQTATVTMSSWACQTGSGTTCVTTPGATFSVPVTFKVYNVVGTAVGSVVATKTQSFAIPYRPSADNVNCTGGAWYSGTTCFNGKAVNITFTFAGETLPNNAIFGISYNTDTHGYSPVGSPGPVDSLNVATYPGTGDNTVAVAPSVGSFAPDGLSSYLADEFGPFYMDNGAGGTGTFRLDTGPSHDVNVSNGPYGGYEPAVQITATN